MDLMKHVLRVLDDALHLQEQALAFDVNTPLLGSLPELDSMAAVALITGLENHFGVTFDEADLNADTFATVGSLCRLVQAYVSPP
ncbi:MAG: acyl carrier protein [Burkholderiales bacterium RIFCSPLOWO2_12_FULL_64_99]|jgi:acyl carrier protein|uniref:acyl carrier protein n=1 Tax=Aquabacterium sp. TaxID=1872578 RepID=UPI0008D0E58D|nr:acyl carrier protein [Aquabacterium sp.]OGB05368.1 MAG: acyl carrier protein [Burkholderiales bacterium RIFCSPHIGHO2_12_FULL_63_20]OGB62372.1 MAG: acyl carrier protein [Burkholderiales bacterium RIFCSPLOWO2_12_FULL_64_99]